MMCQKWQEGTKKVAFPFNDDPQKTMGRFNVDFVSYLKNKSRKIDEKDKHSTSRIFSLSSFLWTHDFKNFKKVVLYKIPSIKIILV